MGDLPTRGGDRAELIMIFMKGDQQEQEPPVEEPEETSPDEVPLVDEHEPL
ncbi:hypothetical protein [Streptosporangium sp. KLBMP 9127]|nr:hypothetical protein [Streptosporangium sp. KLBMP 9127]